MNEYAEPTEMAGIAEAETQAAYAWALDYDDPDEIPTQPIRLTSRRITALSLAASLVLIAVAGAMALGVLHIANQPVTQASSPPVIETVARPVPSPTVTEAPAIPRAGFFGEWGMHGMSVTLAPDGSAHYRAWLGVPLGVTWSATWSPMTSTTAMIILTTQTESHGGAAQRSLYTPEGLTWIDGHSGQALAFTLRGDGYATVQNPSGKLVTLCPNPADFHDTKMLCGA